VDLIVTDLDGTLWDDKGQVHPKTLRALATLEELGIPVLAATGRRAKTAWALMRDNGIGLEAVLLDGAIGLEFAANDALYKYAFSPELAAQVLEILDGLGISPCINVDDPYRDIVLGEHPSIRPEHIERLKASVREEDPRTAVRTLGVLAFTLLSGEASMIRHVATEVVSLAPVSAAISTDRTYGGLHLSLRPLGVNKWAGVLAICAIRGLDPARVMAVGDADNDIEMMDGAAVSLAVSDATAAVLERADTVIAPASQGGWADVVGLIDS
jgi:hypothetical protein